MNKQFEAITVITEAISGLSIQESHRVINFVQSYVYDKQQQMEGSGREAIAQPVQAEQTEMDIPEVPVDVKEVVKKVAKKKAAKKVKNPVKTPEVVPSLEEVQGLCKEVATRLKSADKVKALISECCGVSSLGEVTDTACFVDLAKKLKDA